MKDPKATTKYNYSQISKLWIEDFSSYRENFELIEKAIEIIKSMKLQESKVSDLGSGSGTVADFLIENDLINIDVVEFVPEFVQLLKQKYSKIPSIRVIENDIADYFKQSIKNNANFVNSYIAHFASYSIIHIPDEEIDELFQNIHKTLMKKGILVMSCQEGTQKGYEQDPYQTNNDSRLETNEKLQYYINYFTEDELRARLTKAGFSSITFRKYSPRTLSGGISVNKIWLLARK